MIHRRANSRAFTLAELLAVIGVIAVLAVTVTMSAQRVAKDARVAGATNHVLAALGQARAIAIRDHATVLVGFRIRQATIKDASGTVINDISKPQQTEIIVAKPTGRVGFPGTATAGAWTIVMPAAGIDDLLIEEFEPVEGLPPRLLPAGINVAGSAAEVTDINDIGQDTLWLSQPRLRNSERGSLVVVRFGPDGSVRTRNPSLAGNLTSSATDTSSVGTWIDFNRNGLLDIGTTTSGSNGKFFAFDELNDEALGDHTTFLAIYDSDRMHEEGTPSDWQGYGNWQALNVARTAFVNQFADRIHFNRFTGVAGVTPK
ncbi:MAG: hypothetical protein EXS03_00955 [Phycisphaerales bacterium]|nr:hypothetical protein [Phycisphaerales bacterium]